jgi:hypothetical protein
LVTGWAVIQETKNGEKQSAGATNNNALPLDPKLFYLANK